MKFQRRRVKKLRDLISLVDDILSGTQAKPTQP
jgi:hypothetical protein